MVNSDVELCAARVTRQMPPEKWIKVRITGDGDENDTVTYEKAKEDTTPPSRTFFYGGKNILKSAGLVLCLNWNRFIDSYKNFMLAN